ncbi:hypothetical protein MKW92_026575 [Papaver armeniacum]|nr:hypothetical protein MKW92_026575 [Papaver armeniacum]
MGRPPCCDKTGVKKGPWTPEEDIALVSYIQEHGPGNWRAVPTHTGLLRCSKSCRLRWTNYLRPGIRRGNFTDHEEKMIIHLQALLGNRWAAIASYLPQRTDNDIKNYWNTHLRKKLRKLESGLGNDGFSNLDQQSAIPKGQWERRLQTDMHTAKKALSDALSLDVKSSTIPTSLLSSDFSSSSSHISFSDSYFVKANPPPPAAATTSSTATTYASSTENISRLLQGWMKNSPKSASTATNTNSSSSNIGVGTKTTKTESTTCSSDVEGSTSKPEAIDQSIFGFDSSSNSITTPQSMSSTVDDQTSTDLYFQDDEKRKDNQLVMKSENEAVPFSVIENWLFDESIVPQGQEEGGLFQISLGCDDEDDHTNTSEFF